jgi:hypothetical protein
MDVMAIAANGGPLDGVRPLPVSIHGGFMALGAQRDLF